MLLYHFPLTTDLKNKGFATLYKDSALTKPTNELSSNNALLVNGGQISQKAKGQGSVIGNLYTKSLSTFSFAFRFKADTSYNNVTRFLVLNINSTTNVRQLFLQRGGSGKIAVCYYNGSSYPSPYTITADNAWHSWVINCDNGNMAFYVDNTYLGSLTADFTTRDYVSFSADGWIATASQDGSLMQDFRMWDTILSQAEINEYSRALVVHYTLQCNELNPNVLKDVSGLGNDYTLQGTNSYQLDSARGLKSLHTTDTAIYTQTPISSGYTKSFWCKYNEQWKHLCNNGSKYVDGVVNASQYDTIYATLTASGYDIVDYRVYATALSAEDIKNLYNSPISVSKQHQTMAFEFNENVYPQNYWRMPARNIFYSILRTRTNAANLRTFGKVEISSGTYRGGLFLLPDDWVLPSGISMTITIANFSTNTYTKDQFKQLEDAGAIFFPVSGVRVGTNFTFTGITDMWCSEYLTSVNQGQVFRFQEGTISDTSFFNVRRGNPVRLIKDGTKFSISSTQKIDFAPANLQYHCKKKLWKFAEHQYDIIGTANSNISDDYDGWIDLFGFGCNGVNYPATLHTTNDADYCQVSLNGTDNNWGYNMISESSGFSANKNGIVQHNKLSEAIVYPSKYWRTPTYDEMNYILNTRTNASSLRTLGRVNINGTYVNGCFLLPDDWITPQGLSINPTTANYTTNSYSLADYKKLEDNGAVFVPASGTRYNIGVTMSDNKYYLGNTSILRFYLPNYLSAVSPVNTMYGCSVRLCYSSQDSHSFSTSATTKIKFAKSNLQYHCTQHIWRFAEHSYDFIGADNANISDSYNGWIDLFGYGTSGVNYSPTLHTTNNADYASGDITNTDNDWGINEIQSYEYNQQLYGLYKDKILTNKLIEN